MAMLPEMLSPGHRLDPLVKRRQSTLRYRVKNIPAIEDILFRYYVYLCHGSAAQETALSQF